MRGLNFWHIAYCQFNEIRHTYKWAQNPILSYKYKNDLNIGRIFIFINVKNIDKVFSRVSKQESQF